MSSELKPSQHDGGPGHSCSLHHHNKLNASPLASNDLLAMISQTHPVIKQNMLSLNNQGVESNMLHADDSIVPKIFDE